MQLAILAHHRQPHHLQTDRRSTAEEPEPERTSVQATTPGTPPVRHVSRRRLLHTRITLDVFSHLDHQALPSQPHAGDVWHCCDGGGALTQPDQARIQPGLTSEQADAFRRPGWSVALKGAWFCSTAGLPTAGSDRVWRSHLLPAPGCDEVDVLRLIGQSKRHHRVLVLPVLPYLPVEGKQSSLITARLDGPRQPRAAPGPRPLTTRSAAGRALPRRGSRARCCQEVAWWRSTGSSRPWSGP